MAEGFIDVGSPIMQAYFQGLALRQQRQMQMFGQQLAQRKQQEEERQAGEQEKFRQQQLQELKRQHDLQTKQFETGKKLQEATLKAHLQDAYNRAYHEGTIEAPTTSINGVTEVPVSQVPSNVLPDFNLQVPTGVPQWVQKMKQDELNRKAMLEQALAVAGMTADRTAMLEEGRDRRFAEGLASMEKRSAMSMAAIAGRKDEARDFQDRKAALAVANNVHKDRLYGKYVDLKSIDNYINEITKDPNKMSGIDDISLIYQWIRGQDQSVVRPSEIDLAWKAAMPWLQKLGIQSKNLLAGPNLLTPQARYAIAQDAKKRLRTLEPLWQERRGSAIKQIKFMTGNKFNDAEINDLIIGATPKPGTLSFDPNDPNWERLP